jgi:hypothetical protein
MEVALLRVIATCSRKFAQRIAFEIRRWVAFGFGAAVGALMGHLLGRQRSVPAHARARRRPHRRHQPSDPLLPLHPSNTLCSMMARRTFSTP